MTSMLPVTDHTNSVRRPLDQYPVIRTRDTEQMRAALVGVYGARKLLFSQGVAGFSGHANHAQLRHIGLSYCSYKIPVELHFPDDDYVRQQFCVKGFATTFSEATATEIDQRRSCVSPADSVLRFGAEYEQIALRIPRAMLKRKITSLLGSQPNSSLQFESSVDLDEASARHLRNLVWFLTQTLDESGLELPRISIDELEEAIVLAFVCGVRNSLSEQIKKPAQRVAPWQVKRAEEFIEANWSEPLTVEILAKEIDSGVRSIFKTFSDFRGYSPIDFLRSVRLGHARSMLTSPKQTTTVTSVALACGFSSLGHFAKHYRQKFGELPSETLARGR